MTDEPLPDVLGPGLKAIFCGSAAGRRSAAARAYYAGPGNRFWDILHRIGLTPHRLAPGEYNAVLAYGIGLTDIVKLRSGNDGDLRRGDFDAELLRQKITQYEPRVVGFNGKRAAQAFFAVPVDYGMQKTKLGATEFFVLPSTSGAARKFWHEGPWRALGQFILMMEDNKI